MQFLLFIIFIQYVFSKNTTNRLIIKQIQHKTIKKLEQKCFCNESTHEYFKNLDINQDFINEYFSNENILQDFSNENTYCTNLNKYLSEYLYIELHKSCLKKNLCFEIIKKDKYKKCIYNNNIKQHNKIDNFHNLLFSLKIKLFTINSFGLINILKICLNILVLLIHFLYCSIVLLLFWFPIIIIDIYLLIYYSFPGCIM